MKEVIARLRKEMAETTQKRSEHRWFEEGKKEGWDFAMNVHYETLAEALSWDPEDRNFADKLEAAYDEAEWDDDFSQIRHELSAGAGPKLAEILSFSHWARGFMTAVHDFWNEVSDELHRPSR